MNILSDIIHVNRSRRQDPGGPEGLPAVDPDHGRCSGRQRAHRHGGRAFRNFLAGLFLLIADGAHSRCLSLCSGAGHPLPEAAGGRPSGGCSGLFQTGRHHHHDRESGLICPFHPVRPRGRHQGIPADADRFIGRFCPAEPVAELLICGTIRKGIPEAGLMRSSLKTGSTGLCPCCRR